MFELKVSHVYEFLNALSIPREQFIEHMQPANQPMNNI